MMRARRVFDDPRWWAALTLDERRPAGARAVAADTDRGWLRMQLWEDGRFVPSFAVSLRRRAETLGINVETLIALLGEPPEALRTRMPAVPRWLQVLAEAFPAAESRGAQDGCRCGGSARDELPVADPDAALLRWIEPLTTWARDDLRHRLAETLPDQHPLLVPDSGHLLAMIKRALVLEVNIARELGELCGRTPASRFGCFAQGLIRPDIAVETLVRYPVLARQLVEQVETWRDTRLELATRFRADLPLLRLRFGLVADGLTDIDQADFGAGDPHRRGRTVAILGVRGDLLVYKPRSLAVERHFAETVERLNRAGLRHALRPLEVVERDGYGWTRHIAARPCADDAAVQRFHYRQGAYLAILYALRAYDMHMGNLVADGEHPVFIDLEAVFHAPAAFERQDSANGESVGAVLRESVLAVGLLPVPTVVADETGARAVDISGLTGGRTGRTVRLHLRAGFRDEGTDRMSVVRVPDPYPEAVNLPRLWGTTAPVAPETLEAGFVEAYRLLEGADDILSAFAGDPVRVVLRDTAMYSALLAESWHPDLLRDGLDREHWFELVTVRGTLCGWPDVVEAERAQLTARDVPLFEGTADGTTLTTHDGHRVTDLLTDSGLDHARLRLGRFSDDNLRRQLWFLRASLATAADHLRSPASADDLAAEILPTDPVTAAVAVGDRLVADAIGVDDGPEWVTLNDFGEGIWTIGPTDLGLTSGVTGIALFLAELDGAVGHPGARRIVEALLDSLLPADDQPDTEDLAGMSTGRYNDLGALVQLLVRMRELWSHEAPPLPGWLNAAVLHNLEATPSSVVTLLTLHTVSPSGKTTEALRRVRSDLLGYRPLPEAAWGDRGADQAFALAVLADALGDEGLARAAERVLQEDPDLNSTAGRMGSVLAASGMLALPATHRATVAKHLRTQATALQEVAGRGTGTDALLGGDLGVAEALAAAGAALSEPEFTALADLSAANVCRRAARGKTVTAVPTGVWNPGLLTGAAGIGYGLLRAARPTIPGVLGPPSRLVISRPDSLISG
jgi:lantibiotic modifying enzyme